jgi:site-specific DNA-cytosine methylase
MALDLFSGIGGMALAVHTAFPGLRLWRLCEADAGCREVLARRFPGVPCEPDVVRMRGDPGAGVCLVYGGFPCQDVSAAGRRAGVERGERSSLFAHMIRLAVECRAPLLLMENVAALRTNGLDVVCARLREAGYAEIRWTVLGADAVGLRHRRLRLFLAARNPAFGDPALRLSEEPLDALMPLRPEPPGSRLEPRPASREAVRLWKMHVRMLGNTCVPRQALVAIQALFKAWRRGDAAMIGDDAACVKQMFAPRTRDSRAARTLIASDCLHIGGRLLDRRATGEYAGMSIPRWVRHNPDAGDWGIDRRARQDVVAGSIMSVHWAEWFMGLPEGWLRR